MNYSKSLKLYSLLEITFSSFSCFFLCTLNQSTRGSQLTCQIWNWELNESCVCVSRRDDSFYVCEPFEFQYTNIKLSSCHAHVNQFCVRILVHLKNPAELHRRDLLLSILWWITLQMYCFVTIIDTCIKKGRKKKRMWEWECDCCSSYRGTVWKGHRKLLINTSISSSQFASSHQQTTAELFSRGKCTKHFIRFMWIHHTWDALLYMVLHVTSSIARVKYLKSVCDHNKLWIYNERSRIHMWKAVPCVERVSFQMWCDAVCFKL